MTKVRQELRQEEEDSLKSGNSLVLHEVSMTQFLLHGLELEEAQ